MLNPTPYPELNSILQELVSGMQAALGDTFIGFYLQGSFAVGDFDEDSDVDFIVAIRQELTDEQVEALQGLHARIYDQDNPWCKYLEGSYFPLDSLRDYTRSGGDLWYIDNGSRQLERYNHCNTILVRWVVREMGLPLAGPDPATLVDPIPVEALRRYIYEDMNHWGQQILEDPARYNNQFYQGFIALNYARMLHDLINGEPGSKLAGANWAKANLDPQWAGLLDRAWATRPKPEVTSRTPADPEDYAATLDFVRYVMAESDKAAARFGLV